MTEQSQPQYCRHMASSATHVAIGQSVGVAVKLSGLSMADVAKRSGVSAAAIRRIIAGGREAAAPTLCAIAAATGTNPVRLFDRTLCEECVIR